jgi:hypothetical protein
MEIRGTPDKNTVAPFLEQDAEIERSESELAPVFAKVANGNNVAPGVTGKIRRNSAGKGKLRKLSRKSISQKALDAVDEETESTRKSTASLKQQEAVESAHVTVPETVRETVPETVPEVLSKPDKGKGFGRGSIIKWLGGTSEPSPRGNWPTEIPQKSIEVQEAEKRRELRDSGVIGLDPESAKESDSDEAYTYAAASREIAGLNHRPEGDFSSKRMERALQELDGDVPPLSLQSGSPTTQSPLLRPVCSPKKSPTENGYKINRSISNPERRPERRVGSLVGSGHHRGAASNGTPPSPERSWVTRFQNQNPYQPPAYAHGVQNRMDDVFSVHELSSDMRVDMAYGKQNSPVSHTVSPGSPNYPRTPLASPDSPRFSAVGFGGRRVDEREMADERHEEQEEDKDWVKC